MTTQAIDVDAPPISDLNAGLALIESYSLHRRKMAEGYLCEVAERKGKTYIVSLDDNRHPQGCTCGNKNARYLCKHIKFMQRPEVRSKARYGGSGESLPEQPRAKTPPEGLRVVSTKALWRRTEIVGHVCILIDDTTDHVHYVCGGCCTCYRPYDKCTKDCVHLKWLHQLPGFSKDAFEREAEIVQPDTPAPIHSINVVHYQADFRFAYRDEGDDWTSEEAINKREYTYRLTFKDGLNGTEKESMATLKRALKFYKRRRDRGLGYRTHYIDIHADYVDMRLETLRKFESWMSFTAPLDNLLSQARQEYAAKQRAEKERWKQYKSESTPVVQSLLLFQLDENATREDIEIRYWQLRQQLQTEMGGDAASAFKFIDYAYQVLIDWTGEV